MGKRKGKNSRIKRKSATETVQKESYDITPKVESNVPKTARPYTATNNDKEKRYILSKYKTESILTDQLNSNTKIICGLGREISKQNIDVAAKQREIVRMKEEANRVQTSLDVVSKQNSTLFNAMSTTKLNNSNIRRQLQYMDRWHRKLNETAERYKEKIESLALQNKSLESQLVEIGERLNSHRNAHKCLKSVIATLKKKNMKQIKEDDDLKLEISQYEDDIKEKDGQLKKRKEKIFHENANKVAKVMTEQIQKISLLRLSKEQEKKQDEKEILKLSNKNVSKQNEHEELEKRNSELKLTLKNIGEMFFSKCTSVKSLIDIFKEELGKKSRCFNEPEMNESIVMMDLQLLLGKINEEFSNLHLE